MSAFPILSNIELTLRKWATSLKQLDLVANFGATLQTNISIEPGKEVSIRHNLGKIPRMVIPVKQKGGVIDGGDTANTSEVVYLKNRASTTTAIVDVLILP